MRFSNSSLTKKESSPNLHSLPYGAKPLTSSISKTYPGVSKIFNQTSQAHLDGQISTLGNVFASIIQTSNLSDIKLSKNNFTTLRENSNFQEMSKKDSMLKEQLDQLDKAFLNYQIIQKDYLENVLKLDNLSAELISVFESPINGLNPQALNIIKGQITALNNLSDLSDKVGLESITKLVEAEIHEVIFFLEEWGKSVQKGIKEVLPNAIANYSKLLNESIPNEPLKALAHYHDLLLARQRLVILQKFKETAKDSLPLITDFKKLQEKFYIDEADRINFSYLDKALKTIDTQIEPLLKEPLPSFAFPASHERGLIIKEIESKGADSIDSFYKESLLHILKDSTLEPWKTFMKQHTQLLFEMLPHREKSFISKFASWLGKPLYDIS
nr:hypothetical protein [Candidatus Anoxychlamydiales bacterium]